MENIYVESFQGFRITKRAWGTGWLFETRVNGKTWRNDSLPVLRNAIAEYAR